MSEADVYSLLIEAAQSNKVNILQKLLHEGADINRYHGGKTALCEAAVKGCSEAVEYLIQNGADIHRPQKLGPDQRCAIHLAAFNGHIDIVQKLLDAGVSVNANDGNMVTPLMSAACEENNLDILDYLFSQGALVNYLQPNGFTVIHTATYLGNSGVLAWLLIHGANLNEADNENWTPLHAAMIRGKPDVVKLFLDWNANVNMCTSSGDTPLHLAVSYRHDVFICEQLVQYGADINARNKFGITPVYNAVKYSQLDIVYYLVDMNCCLNFKESELDTYSPIFPALYKDTAEYVKLLLCAGLNIYAPSKFMKILEISQYNKPVCSYISNIMTKPQSLRFFSKLVINRQLIAPKSNSVHLLPLPKFLQTYLSIKHFQDEDVS